MSTDALSMQTLQDVSQQLSNLRGTLDQLGTQLESQFAQLFKQTQGAEPQARSAQAVPAPSGPVLTSEAPPSPAQDSSSQLLDMLNQINAGSPAQAATGTASEGQGLALEQRASNPQALVNQEAVAAAKADSGRYSNGLTLYQQDPQSHAWQRENIHDDELRKQLNELPLSRDSLLNILSQDDPYRAIADIHQGMGTYTSLDAHGDEGAKLLTVRDSQGNALRALDIGTPETWNSQTAMRVQDTLAQYGVRQDPGLDWTDPQGLFSKLDQTPPAGQFNESPAVQLAKYGFRTDPLNGQVVGGGSTSAIEYYTATGRMPPPEEVWK
ncbi:hypothetical protein D5125_05565 [Magnetovirga frankeli]|uniref:hypothetical protein n=1 Tax=Magnetovirga frankeli TaxID=947516 RepID=UPI001293E238|nr:hypothetical protein D5125_05565 [gamma proteobacterium SS-5]